MLSIIRITCTFDQLFAKLQACLVPGVMVYCL
jgi:hypothetical protein